MPRLASQTAPRPRPQSFVLDVSLADGIPAVLKLLIPRDFEAAGKEITVLQLANGDLELTEVVYISGSRETRRTDDGTRGDEECREASGDHPPR